MPRINISTKKLVLKIDREKIKLKQGERNNIKYFYLWDYHPLYKKKKQEINGIKHDVRCYNEKFDYISELLLRLKDNDETAGMHVKWVLLNQMEDLILKYNALANSISVVIPSSDSEKKRTPIDYIVLFILSALNEKYYKKFELKYYFNALNRHTSIKKLAHGGNRSEEIHLASISCNLKFKEDECIILFDDIITSGNSMSACCKILKKCGAKNILCIALAQTSKDSEFSY